MTHDRKLKNLTVKKIKLNQTKPYQNTRFIFDFSSNYGKVHTE